MADPKEAPQPAAAPEKPKRRLAPAVFATINSAVLVFLVVAAVSVWRNKKKTAEVAPRGAEAPAVVEPEEDAVMTATLFFARKEGEGLVPEPREVAVRGGEEDAIRRVVEELARGPRGDGAPVLPSGTRVLRVFRNREGTVFLDLSGEFRQGHWGGAAAEEATVTALTSTLAAGFPDVRAMQILVEGAAVETIAGHVAIGDPIPVRP